MAATHIFIESKLGWDAHSCHWIRCWCRIFGNVLLGFGNLNLLRMTSMNMVVCYIHFFPDLWNLVKHLAFAHFLSILSSLFLIQFLHLRKISEISWQIGGAEVLNALLGWIFFLIKLRIINWRIKSFPLKKVGLHLVYRLMTIWLDIRNLTIVVWESKCLKDGILFQKIVSKSLWWQHEVGVLVNSNLIKKSNILFL